MHHQRIRRDLQLKCVDQRYDIQELLQDDWEFQVKFGNILLEGLKSTPLQIINNVLVASEYGTSPKRLERAISLLNIYQRYDLSHFGRYP